MNPHYPLVAERAGHRCEYCRAPEQIFNFQFEIEHIIPLSLAGDDALENLALACTSCNIFKSDQIGGMDELTLTRAAFFHPRRDAWKEHFTIDLGTAEIHGLTPTGRVTIQALRMNSRRQIAARKEWMQINLYP